MGYILLWILILILICFIFVCITFLRALTKIINNKIYGVITKNDMLDIYSAYSERDYGKMYDVLEDRWKI